MWSGAGMRFDFGRPRAHKPRFLFSFQLAKGVVGVGLAALVGTSSCAAATYSFSFDLTDPGAHNLSKPGERDVLEDGDLRTELLIDATNFQAVLIDLTNKTSAELMVDWRRIAMVTPDRLEIPLHPDASVPAIEPGGRVVVRLITFSLPNIGDSAARLDNRPFELLVPMVVRGVPRQQRYHLVSHATKL